MGIMLVYLKANEKQDLRTMSGSTLKVAFNSVHMQHTYGT